MIVCVYECVVITQMPRNELDLFKDKKKYSVLGFNERNTLNDYKTYAVSVFK